MVLIGRKFKSFMFLAVVIMTCVYHILGVRPGQDRLDTRLLMNGGHGLPMVKLLGISLFHFPVVLSLLDKS